jgi:hypothetical protein
MTILGLLLVLSSLSTQDRSAGTFLEVAGDVETPLRLDAAALKSMPRGSVRAKRDGTETVYEGVFLQELLRAAGVPHGETLRGSALASYVLVEAEDGYRVVFSLAELDPLFIESDVLVADTADGEPLSERDGKLRLVAPKEKRGSRSVRMLHRLTVVRLRK